MPGITIKLDASVIPSDHRVWKFSPGKTYRFYRAISEAKKAFLDIRGLEQLPTDPSSWQDSAVLKIISEDRWRRELVSRAKGNKHRGSEGVTPEDRKRLTYLKELIFDAQKGDLIVVPVDGYRKDVLIGEFTTEPGRPELVVAQDGEEAFTYLGRSVRWLTGVEKRLLSGDLLEKLHSPTAMFILGKTLRHEIYRWAYGDFVYDGEYVATFHVGKDKFTAEDSAVVSVWFNALEILQDALARNDVSSLPDNFYLMGLGKLPDARASELDININSPGSFLFRSRDPFALALMAMFALSACDSSAVVNDQITIEMKVVGTASPDCRHHIEESVKAMANALGAQNAEAMCKLGQRAAQDAKMTVGAHLKP